MRKYLTPEQFSQAYRAVAHEVEDATKNWATKSGMKEEHTRQSFDQARGDAERGQWEAPPLIVSACPERGEMYDMARSEELMKTLIDQCARDLSDPAWSDADSGFRFVPSQQFPSVEAKRGKTWKVVDVHPTVNNPDTTPEGSTMRIVACSQY